MKLILAPPDADDVIRLLRAWRFWVLGAMVGALAGAAIYSLAPPPFRARATVNVDFHLEQAWPLSTDREQFYYLERETRKLEEIAMSDAVLSVVAEQAGNLSLGELREGKIQLSQPGNGGWHFFADDSDPRQASALASAWAGAFAEEVETEVVAATTSGLEPFISARVVQGQQLAARRTLSLSIYLLIGALVLPAVGSLGLLFIETTL